MLYFAIQVSHFCTDLTPVHNTMLPRYNAGHMVHKNKPRYMRTKNYAWAIIHGILAPFLNIFLLYIMEYFVIVLTILQVFFLIFYPKKALLLFWTALYTIVGVHSLRAGRVITRRVITRKHCTI